MVVAAPVAACVAGCRRCCMGEVNHLWNNDAGALSRARLCIFISYNPIRLWWSLYSPAFEVVDRVGAVGLSARCCMGEVAGRLCIVFRPTICDFISNLRNVLIIKLVIYLTR